MIYQIVHPFSLAISGETMKDAIKNYAKYNYDMTINQLIVTDKIKHMKANLKYYNNNKKVQIGMKPVFWNGIGFDSNNRLRIPGLEWPNRPEINFNAGTTLPNRAVFYPSQPQPVMQPVMRPVMQPVIQPVIQPVMRPVMQPVIQPVMQPVIQPVMQPVIQSVPPFLNRPPRNVVATGQPYLYPIKNYMNAGTSDSQITGKTDHYVNVPGSYAMGIMTP
jgi:hypothetical protein